MTKKIHLLHGGSKSIIIIIIIIIILICISGFIFLSSNFKPQNNTQTPQNNKSTITTSTPLITKDDSSLTDSEINKLIKDATSLSKPETPNKPTRYTGDKITNQYGLLIDTNGNIIDLCGNKMITTKYGYTSNGKYANASGVILINQNITLTSDGKLIDQYGNFVNDYGLLINASGIPIDLLGNIITTNNITNSHGYNSFGQIVNSAGKIIFVQNLKIDNNGNLIDNNGRLVNDYGILIDGSGNYIDLSGNLLNTNIYGYNFLNKVVSPYGKEIVDARFSKNKLINIKNILIDSSGNFVDLSGNLINIDLSGNLFNANNMYGYNSDGNVIDQNGNIAYNVKIRKGFLTNSYGLIIDMCGNLIDLSGTLLHIYGYGFNKDGKFSNPLGIETILKPNISINDRGYLVNTDNLLVNPDGNYVNISGIPVPTNKYGIDSYGTSYDISGSRKGNEILWTNIGCYQDNAGDRAIPNKRGTNMKLNECKEQALRYDDTIFGLQDGTDIAGTCYTGNLSNTKYAKYGPSSTCNQYGGSYRNNPGNNVYVLNSVINRGTQLNASGIPIKQWKYKGCYKENTDGTRLITVPSTDLVTRNYIDSSGINAYADFTRTQYPSDDYRCQDLAKVYGYDLAAVSAGKCFVGNKSINYTKNGYPIFALVGAISALNSGISALSGLFSLFGATPVPPPPPPQSMCDKEPINSSIIDTPVNNIYVYE